MSIDLNGILAGIDTWLDDNCADQYKDQPLAQDWARIAKLQEEAGEAIQKFIGYTGQNPRKGVCNSQDDVLDELADVAVTAMAAIQHFTKDADLSWNLFFGKLITVKMRINGSH